MNNNTSEAGGSAAQLFQVLLLSPWFSKKAGHQLGGLETKPETEDLACVKDWLEAGAVMPVIDRAFPLCQVPDAIRYMEAGHARGKIVITVNG